LPIADSKKQIGNWQLEIGNALRLIEVDVEEILLSLIWISIIRLPIANCRLPIRKNKLAIGNWIGNALRLIEVDVEEILLRASFGSPLFDCQFPIADC
jgi:hypothetical protein